MRALPYVLLAMLATACGLRAWHVVADSSCSLPCWNGMQVGQTSQAEVLDRLATLRHVVKPEITGPWEIFDSSVVFGSGRLATLLGLVGLGEGYVNGEASIRDGILVDLTLCGKLNTTLGEVVEAMGEPTGVISMRNPFTGGVDVMLLNERAGYEVQYSTNEVPKRFAEEVSAASPLGCIFLFDPKIYPEMLDARMITGGGYGAAETLGIIRPWAGYGNLEKLYPPKAPPLRP